MQVVDMEVLEEPQRLAAARRARRTLPGMAMPLDAIAALAAQLTDAPMAIVAVMDVVEEHFVGSHGLPAPLADGKPVPAAYSLCKYAVSAGRPVVVADMRADAGLRDHALAVEFGARAFAAVPLRDGAKRTVGSLVVVDTAPRAFTHSQIDLLIAVSRLLHGLPAGSAYTDGPAADQLSGAAILDGVQEAFVAVDAAGTVIGWNPAAQHMLGWTAAEVQGRSFDELILPESEKARFRRGLPQLIASSHWPDGRAQLLQVRHRDGHELPTQAIVSALRGRHGPLVCAFLTDLSGQHNAERDARYQRGFLRALLNSLIAPVAAVDASGRLQIANPAMYALHDVAGDTAVESFDAATLGHLYRPDGSPIAREQLPLLRAAHGERVREEELHIVVPGKPVRIVLANAQPILTTDAQPWGAVLTCHDITEGRRVERFRECQRTVSDALADNGDIRRGADRITEAVATALDWPHVELRLTDELTGALQLAGYHSRLTPLPGQLLTRLVEESNGATVAAWADSTPSWVPDLAAPASLNSLPAEPAAHLLLDAGLHTMLAVAVPAGERPAGVLSCFTTSGAEHDRTQLTALLTGITEQIGQFLAHRHGEQLMAEVERGKDDFLSLTGHELRTPLTVICSSIHMLLNDPDAQLQPTETQQVYEAIARHSDALSTTIDHLLDLAALENGHSPLDMGPADLTALAGEALRAVQAAASDDTDITAELPDTCTVTGDPRRLRQVLDNLLSNAFKYSPPAARIHLNIESHDQVAVITVTDNGIGIPPREQPYLFNRFYRAANARHTTVTGTGLGLSIVRAIINAHHGTITVHDAAPTGTIITVRLPRAAI